MDNEIAVSEDGNGIKFNNRCCLKVRISGDRYIELQDIARDESIDISEALFRIIREGFDI